MAGDSSYLDFRTFVLYNTYDLPPDSPIDPEPEGLPGSEQGF